MPKYKKTPLFRLVAVILILSLTLPVAATAATVETVQPRASDYLNSYSAYIYPAGNGLVQTWFTVTGTDYQEALGALVIQIYESTDNVNWSWVTAFNHRYYPDMMGYNVYYHSGHVDYQGVAGRYYKAYVCIWGGGLTVGDNRYFWTSAKKAV